MKILLCLSALSFLIGCGNDGSASAKLAFTNSSSLSRLAPTTFGMKLISVYLAGDIDSVTQNNIGGTAMIYLNNDCSNDISRCDISAGRNEFGNYLYIVTSYFDFTQGTTAVNTAINAQNRSIQPGTYKYARMEFCKNNQGNSKNIKYRGGSMSADATFKHTTCTVNSSPFSKPISIGDGDAITVTLTYDMSNAITTGTAATGDDCNGTGSSKVCFTLPAFTPSVSTDE